VGTLTIISNDPDEIAAFQNVEPGSYRTTAHHGEE